MAKSTKPFERGRIIRALYLARGDSESNEVAFQVLHSTLDLWGFPVHTDDLDTELLYLEDSGLVALRRIDDHGRSTWAVKLTPTGVDIHEKTVDAPPGVVVVRLKGE